MLRKTGVVGKFVEFYGAGPGAPAARRPRDDRQHVAGVRRDVRRSSRSTTRRSTTCASPAASAEQVELVEAYARRRGCSTSRGSPEPVYSDTLELDLGDRRAEPGRAAAAAGSRRRSATRKRRSERRCARSSAGEAARAGTRRRRDVPGERRAVEQGRAVSRSRCRRTAATATVERRRDRDALDHGSVVIAAITSCTNTSNPSRDDRRRAAGEEGGRARA